MLIPVKRNKKGKFEYAKEPFKKLTNFLNGSFFHALYYKSLPKSILLLSINAVICSAPSGRRLIIAKS